MNLSPKQEIVTLEPDSLKGLIAPFDGADILGFLLTGSHARGEATALSDIDIYRFASVLPPEKSARERLEYQDGRLISLSTTTVESKLDEMRKPEMAGWVVPGLRQAKIIADKTGALASLKMLADEFEWAPLQTTADQYASRELKGLAEEVRKVVNALKMIDAEAGDYATTGLILGLTKAVSVKLGVMITSENSYFRQVEAAVGTDASWTAEHRLACGFDSETTTWVRAIAALKLYIETARLVEPIMNKENSAIVLATVGLAENLLNEGALGSE